MADIHDVMHVDQEMEESLRNMYDTEDEHKEAYYGVEAICRAIQAFGVRVDYVLRDIERNRGERNPNY